MRISDIKDVTLIGAGTMGAGFGLCFALAGFNARLYDISQEQLDLGLDRIKNALDLFVSEGVVEAEAAQEVLPRITTFTDLEPALKDVGFVLEAIPEVMDLKLELYPQLEELAAEGAILASNTSALSITEMAATCKRPENVCGMHWFNPPEMVPLVEVIKGEKTSQATADLVYELTLKLDHEPIMVNKEAPGFVGNRMQLALFREALHILDQGIASPEDVDKALKHGLGFRWSWQGPSETADLGGLDTWNLVSSFLFPRLSKADEAPKFFKDMIAEGRLGLKNGQGFYEYTPEEALEAVRQRDLYFIRQRKLAKDVRGG